MTHLFKGFCRHAAKPIAITALFFCPLLPETRVFAQWSTNSTVNNSISTAANNQWYPAITSDGAGGAIITWHDERNGSSSTSIYAQRIDAAGVVQWAANGVAICTAPGGRTVPSITSDGSGGAYITWQDGRAGFNNSDIYAQHINAAGLVLWTLDGIAVSTAPSRQQAPTIASDGTGGVLIAWEDVSGGSNGIYAQRINAAGLIQWLPAATGVKVSSTGRIPDIVSDGAGGAIISWGTFGVHAQHINAAGVAQWIPTASGVQITAFACLTCNSFPALTSDGFGGAIITWFDGRNGVTDKIFAQRINAGGVVQWATNGVAVTNVPGFEQLDPTIVSDGAGGAIIAWHDDRGGNAGYDVYAQRITGNGAVQWTNSGTAISTAAFDQWHTSIVSDGRGGAVITWEDDRSNGQGIQDIYAQRVNAAGLVQWSAGGVAISTAANQQLLNGRYISPPYRPNIVSNRAGCAIITWCDFRNGVNSDIYAQQINASGNLGGTCTSCLPISLNPAAGALPAAAINTPYSQSFTATGGCASSFTFSLTSGALPIGLTLGANGDLSGAAPQPGNFTFSVTATDSCGCSQSETYTLSVDCPTVPLSVFNTGVANDGSLLPNGTTDPHYVLLNTSPVFPNSLVLLPNQTSGYVANNASSQWLAPNVNVPNSPVGFYSYRTTFNLACDPSTAVISGQWATDNEAEIFLNGIGTGIITGPNDFAVFTPFVITAGFVPGVNTLDFRVRNRAGGVGLPTRTGLRVEMSGTVKCCPACAVRPAGMVGWWPLDETSGAVVDDIAGFNNQGVPKPGGLLGSTGGPAPTVGKVNGALYFAGPYVEVPPQMELDFGAGDFSIDAWVRPVDCSHGGGGVRSPIVDKFDGTTGFSFYLDQPTVGLANLYLNINGLTFVSSGTIPTLGSATWSHVAVTIARPASATAVGTFFINGVAAGTFTPPPGSVTNALPMWIGNTRIAGGSCEIAIDEIELFNRALDKTEVNTIFDAGSMGKCKPTPGTGTIIIRKSTVGRDATFAYTTGTGLSAFSITTSGRSGSQTFSNIAPGPRTVTESQPPTGWMFTNLTCSDPDSGTAVSGKTANIDLDAGETVTCIYTNTICPDITLDPAASALPAPAINTPYSQTFSATGGCSSSFNYSVTSGALPNGLTLGADGVLTGTPTKPGTYDFTVTATDACGCSKSQTYTLTANVRRGDFPFTEGMNEVCIWGGGGGGYNFQTLIDGPIAGVPFYTFTPGNTRGGFSTIGLCYGRVLFANDKFAFKYTFNAIPVAVLSYREFNPVFGDFGFPVSFSETRRNVYGAGLSPIGFQLYFRPQSRVKPFLSTSAGFISFTDPVPPLNGARFNFTYDFGGGVQVFRNSRRAFTFGYKYQRISNSGGALNNPSFGGNIFYFGYSIFKAPRIAQGSDLELKRRK